MNIGKWIVASFILFAAFIATLVTICVRQDVSLVSKEYYRDELNYQAQLTRLNNTARLAVKPKITMSKNEIIIEFNDHDSVQLTLFRPSNAVHDKHFQLDFTRETTQRINCEHFEKGMYRARMQWESDGKEFYFEEIINL